MNALFVVTFVTALFLGIGAGKGSRVLYGLGFWSTIVMLIVTYFYFDMTSVFIAFVGAIIVAVVVWFIALSLRIGGATRS